MCDLILISEGRFRSGFRGRDRLVERRQIVAITAHRLHEPSICRIPCRNVFGEGKRRRSVDRDVVVIIDDDQIVQSEMTGK